MSRAPPSTGLINPNGNIAAVFYGMILNPDSYHAHFDQTGW